MLCNYAKCDTMIREKLKEKILTMSDAQQNALLLAARDIKRKSKEQGRELYENAQQTNKKNNKELWQNNPLMNIERFINAEKEYKKNLLKKRRI